MHRHQAFATKANEPFRTQSAFDLQKPTTTGPFRFLNPTTAHFTHREIENYGQNVSSVGDGTITEENATQQKPKIRFRWRARDNRKGRHAIVVEKPSGQTASTISTPPKSTSFSAISKGILRMFTYYPYWDVSWHVAVIFTWGSIIWVINAFFVYLPDAQPQTLFNNEISYGGGITAFIGATVFEIGSVLLMLEAVNENESGCFGWALEQAWEGEKGTTMRLRPNEKICSHHHTNKRNFVGKSDVQGTAESAASSDTENGQTGGAEKTEENEGRSWQWWPSNHALFTHYIYELGFLACSFQFMGASVFWISGFTALPGINNVLSQPVLNGVYWIPQARHPIR